MAEIDPDPEVEPIAAEIIAAVAASMRASPIPEETETEIEIALRLVERERIDALVKQREQWERAAREREQLQREAAQRAEQERKAVAARQAAQAEAREKLAQQQREQAAARDRDRLTRLEAELTAQRVPQLTPEQRRQQELVQACDDYLAWCKDHLNPKRDPLAEIDAIHADLAAREEALEQRMAAEREAQRSAKYYSDQAAAIARRESGKW
jgi:hypothetical protein